MPKNIKFATDVYDAAKKMEQTKGMNTGVSPLFTCAQACLETGWGASKVGNYNLWGIKAYSTWKGKRVLVRTTEIIGKGKTINLQKGESIVSQVLLKTGSTKYVANLWFRDYDSLTEAIQDHNKILRNFETAWNYRDDPVAFVKALQSSKPHAYATDPNYTNSILSMYNTLKKLGIK